MKANCYICPRTREPLEIVAESKQSGDALSGVFRNSHGDRYPINDGLPDFCYPSELTPAQQQQHAYYESNADNYDNIQGVTFALQNEDEPAIRKKMVDELRLKPADKVLELACGTGRDSVNIAASLGPQGEFYVQDLSVAMLKQCRDKLKPFSVPFHCSRGNATNLPFPDNYFDAVFSFGGLNVFPDRKKSLKEMVRVTKSNGRIVVGDEGMPPWLYDTEFGKILLNGNPLLSFKVPLEDLPFEARDVSVQWIIGGVYYLISFAVGVGEPAGNFDLEIPGRRGGTLKTRYYGRLEGVTTETRQLVVDAASKANVSLHEFIDGALRAAVEQSQSKA